MKEMLADAQKRNYGVGFFNTFNADMARAIIGAAEECNSPVIIGPAESLLKYGTFDWTMPVLLEQGEHCTVSGAPNVIPGMYARVTVTPEEGYGLTSVTINGKEQLQNVSFNADGSVTLSILGICFLISMKILRI